MKNSKSLIPLKGKAKGRICENIIKSDEVRNEGGGTRLDESILFWIQGTISRRLTWEDEARSRCLDGINSAREFLQLFSS